MAKKKWVMKEPKEFPAIELDNARVGVYTPSAELMTDLGFELIEVPPIEFEATVINALGNAVVIVPDSLMVGDTRKFRVIE